MSAANFLPNPARGEAALMVGADRLVVRPSFAALVAAEAELGSLLALVDRAADGRLLLTEMVALIWHCLEARPAELAREAVGEALIEQGVGALLPAVRCILRQILAGAP